MSLQDLTFADYENSYGVFLSPEEVHLFYYDIGFDSVTGQSFFYSWDDEIEKFTSQNHLIIDVCEAASIPTTFSENKIFFTIKDDGKETKAVAFFRHIRNSFAHYNIGASGDYYCMKDFPDNGDKVTMIGKIHRRLFKELINIFFNQKAKAEEEMNKLYYRRRCDFPWIAP